MGGLERTGPSAAPSLWFSVTCLSVDGGTIYQLPGWKPAVFLILESSLGSLQSLDSLPGQSPGSIQSTSYMTL